tara:strand:+ start:623 stop:1036 length:414 start_codon:yes stop_codon:yes gene_type:complete
MTIKYKPHKDFDNRTVVSYSKWDDSTFLMAIPKDEANMDYQQYLEDFKSHGMSILIIDDIGDGVPDESMWQYLDNAEQLLTDKYGSDSDKLTALREHRYVRAMKAEFPYESKDKAFKIINSTSEEIKQKYRYLPMRR